MKNKYRNYTADDLVQDDDFLAWQRQPERTELNRRWQQWLEQNPEQKEKVTEAKLQLDQLRFRPTDTTTIDQDALWSRIDKATSQPSARIRPLGWVAAAAAVAVLAISFFFLFPRTTTIDVARGQQLAYTLPDNSRAFLNAESSLRYAPQKWDNNRAVQLDGEAYFTVETGSSFAVETARGSVTVLGTQFNVFQRGNRFHVSCHEGRVAVRTGTADTIVLTPGNGCRLVDGTLQRFVLADSLERPAWIGGLFSFEQAPLQQVFAELERQYDVQIDYTDRIGKRTYSGFFETGDLDEALYEICWPMGLDYQINGPSVRIRTNE